MGRSALWVEECLVSESLIISLLKLAAKLLSPSETVTILRVLQSSDELYK